VIAVPDGLEDGVGKTEDHDVLDRLFAQVMVDPVDLRFVEPFRGRVVELSGALQIAAKRLLHHKADPFLTFAAVLSRQARRADPLDDGLIQEGRNREVEHVAAVYAVPPPQFRQLALDTFVGPGVAVIAAEIIELVEERPRYRRRSPSRIPPDGVGRLLAELLVGVGGTATA
jgi:hypothetical protein